MNSRDVLTKSTAPAARRIPSRAVVTALAVVLDSDDARSLAVCSHLLEEEAIARARNAWMKVCSLSSRSRHPDALAWFSPLDMSAGPTARIRARSQAGEQQQDRDVVRTWTSDHVIEDHPARCHREDQRE